MIEWILSSSILILIVIALRIVFKGKISLRLQYAMWGLVLLRLLLPISFGSADFSVANFANLEKVPPVVTNTVKPNTYVPDNLPAQNPQPGEFPSQEIIQSEPEITETTFDVSAYIPYVVWGLGFVAVTGMFVMTNRRFKRRSGASLYDLDTEKEGLEVWVARQIDTPCLFGVLHPVIYVTEPVAKDKTLLRHTLEHETTHYRHRDHIWAVLRCLCLAIHWYNPLVWWAAFLSQRDAELACDEATIKRLGEGERAEYGRTLIGMTCLKKTNVLMTATTMAIGKNGLKERILLIAKKPKMALYTLLIVITVAAVAVGCTFTGANTEEPESSTESLFHWGVILDEAGNVVVRRPLTGPAEETGGQNPETQPPEETIGLPEVLHCEPEYDKICIAVQPTGLVSEGGAFLYIIPENQEVLLDYYTAAEASAHEYTRWDSSNLRSGWWIVYQDQWWQVTESGAMFGTDPETWEGICIDADDAKELYEFCDGEVKQAGIAEPVRPEELTSIKSATLYWNGVHTVTDEYALNKLEKWFTNARESSSTSCWFTAQLVLELENGKTKTITMATDSCAYYMTEGVAYGYGELTLDGINGNEEFYSLFAPAVIYEKSREGMDAVTEYMIYLNWSRYCNQFGWEETIALIDAIEMWAAEEPTYSRFGGAISWTTGLDGFFSDYYGVMLTRLYELAPAEFAWACLGNASEANAKHTLEMFAYQWNMTVEEVRAKLKADIPQN